MPLSKEKKRTAASLIITLAIIVLFYALHQIPPLKAVYETLELKMLDLRFILEPQPTRSGKIVHIDIDDATIKRLGWPCPRKYYAYLIDVLTECGSEAIIFDILFLERSHLTVDRVKASDISLYLTGLKDGTGEALYLLQRKLDNAVLDQDKLVANAIRKGHNIFLPFFFPEEPGGKAKFISKPIDTFSTHITGTGFVNAGSLDRDGVMRRIPLLWEYKGDLFPQLTFSGFLELSKGDLEIVPGKYIKINDEITIPIDKKMHMIIHWAGGWEEAFQHIPFHDIVELKKIRDILEENLIILDDKYTSGRLSSLKKELELSPAPSPELVKEIDEAKRDIFEFLERYTKKSDTGELKDDYGAIDVPRKKIKKLKNKIMGFVEGKICFVGLAGTATHDRRPIPIEPDYPMVGLHSNLLNTILTRNFIREASLPLNLAIFILAGILIATAVPGLSPWKGMGISFILLGLFIAIGQYLFQEQGLAINMAGPMALIISSYTAITSYRYVTEEKEKRWVRKAFSHYLSPKVMEEILADPGKLGLGGKRQEITVLFSDIRSFTSYCEKRSPEGIIHILNEYLDVMSNVILKYNGTLDKYVGDEIVAFYGAPAMKIPVNHAEMAVRTALEMVEELKKLQEKWKREGKEPLDFGVGINTGQMMVGNMGSTNRLDYTVIGDEVNLGARVEALTRDYNVRIIITHATYEKVKDMVEVKKLGEATVKGKSQAVVIYELTSLK